MAQPSAQLPHDDKDAASPQDRQILRDLAKRVADIAALPIMQERIDLWRRHNSLQPTRPMILISPEGSWRELLSDSSLRCVGKTAQAMEKTLRMRIYTHEHFDDDTVITGDWPVGVAIRNSGWGVQAKWHLSTQAGGARTFDPVIIEAADLKKLKFPEISIDEKASERNLRWACEAVGDILTVRQVKVCRISFHLMSLYTSLRGLEQVMVDMLDNPQMLHDAMAFLAEGHARLVKQYMDLNLLALNNDNTYHSSGGNGWTNELPRAGFDAAKVRPCDMWASAESQELAQVSPEMHAEFALRYETPLLAPFGLNGYGCCEDLTRKLDDVLKIPNIRRISISPWANVEACAAKLQNRYIFSWKPHPAMLAGRFDPQHVRQYIGDAVRATRGCVMEMILKDTHTCDNHPERFTQWSQIARQIVQQG